MPKYDAIRKDKRNRELFDYAESHKDLSQEEVGQVFGGISSVRVSQIKKKERERRGMK